MSFSDLQGIAPLLVLGIGAIVLMLQISVRRQIGWTYAITLATLLLAAAAMQPALQLGEIQVTPLLRVDNFALFFSTLFCLAGAATAVISHDYLRFRKGQHHVPQLVKSFDRKIFPQRLTYQVTHGFLFLIA